MNSAHVAATGGLTSALAAVLVWASHWPLQPLDDTSAAAIAGLVIAGVGMFLARKPTEPPEPPAPEPKP